MGTAKVVANRASPGIGRAGRRFGLSVLVCWYGGTGEGGGDEFFDSEIGDRLAEGSFGGRPTDQTFFSGYSLIERALYMGAEAPTPKEPGLQQRFRIEDGEVNSAVQRRTGDQQVRVRKPATTRRIEAPLRTPLRRRGKACLGAIIHESRLG